MDANAFSKIIKNFSQKECRFDSRTEPMFRLFEMLPLVIQMLQVLATTDVWAKELFRTFGGPSGYDRLVSAAIVGDAMLVLGKFINASQEPDIRLCMLCNADMSAHAVAARVYRARTPGQQG